MLSVVAPKIAGKARNLPLEGEPRKGSASSTLIGSSLACKYLTFVEGIGSSKHSSLLLYVNNYGHKKLYSTGPWGGFHQNSYNNHMVIHKTVVP
jgi:hypothetical protein